jgi:chromosome partitioning protein
LQAALPLRTLNKAVTLQATPLQSQATEPPQRIIVLNPKGGSGKTTIATNLASYYAVQGLKPTLMDFDPQGSSWRWVRKRINTSPPIHGIAAFERNSRVTRSFALRIPQESLRVVIDTPAALVAQAMPDLTRQATAILVPVLPSDIDIHAAARCISNLLLVAKIRRSDQRIGVIANRVKKHTLVYGSLMRFLESLKIPVVATFRDSQAYIRAAETGLGIFEMKAALVQDDLAQWQPLVDWLAKREPKTESGNPLVRAAVAGTDTGSYLTVPLRRDDVGT